MSAFKRKKRQLCTHSFFCQSLNLVYFIVNLYRSCIRLSCTASITYYTIHKFSFFVYYKEVPSQLPCICDFSTCNDATCYVTSNCNNNCKGSALSVLLMSARIIITMYFCKHYIYTLWQAKLEIRHAVMKAPLNCYLAKEIMAGVLYYKNIMINVVIYCTAIHTSRTIKI